MSDEKTSLTAALRYLAEQERRTPSEHSTPGELTAYHEGTLPPEVEARVREHLAHCKLCSDLLLDLAGFADLAPPPGVAELTDAQVAEDWQALKARMGEGEERPRALKSEAEVVPIRRSPAPALLRPDREFSPWQVLAAAALVATVGLSGWVAVLKRDLASFEKRENELRVGGSITVFDDGDQVRGVNQGRLPTMSASQPATFLFHSLESDYPLYHGEIVAGDRKIVWRTALHFALHNAESSPQTESELKQISFWVPSGTLKLGQYEARLFGVGTEGGRELIGRLEFEVNAP